MLCLLRLDIEAHDHGGEAQRPWVAEIAGPSLRYGLDRRFLKPHNDWREARQAWSGNVYGRTAQFPLRDGKIYEVGRYRGSGAKLRFVREFVRVADGKRRPVDAVDVLDEIDVVGAGAVTFAAPESVEHPTIVSRVVRVGPTVACSFVVVDGERTYRLASGGLYDVACDGAGYLVEVCDGTLQRRTQQEGIAWLSIRL